MEQKKTNEEIEIDLGELIGLLLSRWMTIALTSLLVALLAYGYAEILMTPQYRSTTQIYVISQQNTDTVNYTDLQVGQQLTNDYVIMIESRSVLEQVINSMNLEYTYEQLLGKLSVTAETNTRIIDITVTDSDPYEAKRLADAIREVASEKITNVMQIDSVNVLEKGNIARKPSSPNVMRSTLVGFLAGLLLSVGFTLLVYLLNDSVQTPDDVEKYLGLSVLGSIPLDEVKAEQERRNQKLKKKAEKKKRAQRLKRTAEKTEKAV